MIEVKDLHKSYSKDVQVLKGLNFHIEKGSITSLLGPNGAGKTTTLDIITGIKKLDSGSVVVNGIDISQSDSYKEKIGVMLQETQIYKKIKVKEALQLFASFYKEDINLDILIQTIGLKGFDKRFFSSLSGGEKQKLFLGIALVNNPDLLILDEPTSALDPISKREFWEILNCLRLEGKTILLSTHNLQEAEFLSDYIMIIKKGEIIANGTINDVRETLKWGKIITLSLNPIHAAYITKELLTIEDVETICLNNTIEIKCKNSSAVIQALTTKFDKWDDYFINIEIKSIPLEKVFMEIIN